MTNAEIVRSFLTRIAAGAEPEEIASFYADDCEQVEFPNRLVPAGMVRDRAALEAAAGAGKNVLRSQSFEVVSLTEAKDFVALEAVWRGILAVPVGTLAAGETMTANFAQFFEFHDGKIHRQRNYDCFHPF